MENEIIEKLIAKYISGNISEEEKKYLEDWYSTFEIHEGYTDQISDKERKELGKKILHKINYNIDAFEGIGKYQQSKIIHFTLFKNRKYLTNALYKIAVVLLAVIMVSALFYGLFRDRKAVFSTAYGQTLTIKLPDSSVVTLNGNSTLTYKNRWFNNGPREVFLDGEAFFSIKHKEDNQKFIVSTSDQFNVEVLGTEFNVSKRRSGTRVVLNSGRIQLNIKEAEENKQVVMNPGDLVEFKGDPVDYIKKEVNPNIYSSWKDKRLILDHTSLREILTMLQENYGLKTKSVDNDLLDQKVSGSMPAYNINMILKNIEATYKVIIFKDNNVIEIKKQIEQ